MLRIALCDDDPEQCAALCLMMKDFARQHPQLAVKLSVFSSPWQLLAEEEEAPFEIFLLDVMMPELSGIQLGTKLREMGSRAAIIYLTVSPEYALDSYEVDAFHYLIKPVQPSRLFSVLDKAVQSLERQREASVTVKTKAGLFLARLDQIVYVELSGRVALYHLSDGACLESVTLRGSFQEETAPLLAHTRFFHCGASFVVNLFYVAAVEKRFLLLDGGRQIPLPRSLAAQARQRWSDFWLDSPESMVPSAPRPD